MIKKNSNNMNYVKKNNVKIKNLVKPSHFIFACVIVLTLLLTSCGTDYFPGSSSSSNQIGKNYFVGKEGIKASFLSSAPPSKTYEGSIIDIQLALENNGAFDVLAEENNRVYLTYSIDEYYLEKLNVPLRNEQDINALSLKGKSYYTPLGDKIFLTLGSFRVSPFKNSFKLREVPLIVQLCYPYNTYFSTEVCIDTNTDGSDFRVQACKSKSQTFNSGQGAPVGVTSVTPKMIPRGVTIQPEFILEIKNYGKGVVGAYDSELGTNSCIDTEVPINQVSITGSLGNAELDCYPQVLKLIDGEGSVTCVWKTGVPDFSSNYLTSLNVNIEYTYSESFSKNVVLERVSDINLEYRDLTDESFCYPWEIFYGNNCVNRCDYCVEHAFEEVCNVTDISRNTRNPKNFRTGMSCTYLGKDACQDAGDSCLLQDGFCQTGTFCGISACVENNKKPKVKTNDFDDAGEIVFTCYDSDDMNDLSGTCGCEEQMWYSFMDRSSDCKEGGAGIPVIANEYDRIGERQKVYRLNVRDLNTNNNKYLCLEVMDKLGKRSVLSKKIPVTLLESE